MNKTKIIIGVVIVAIVGCGIYYLHGLESKIATLEANNAAIVQYINGSIATGIFPTGQQVIARLQQLQAQKK